MRHLAFVAAAIGLMAVAAPASAGAAGGADAIVRAQSAAPQSSQPDAFSAQRRHHRHWHGPRHHWRGHHHWRRHHVRPYYGGWHRCRSVWRPHAGWVRVCRW